MSLRFICLAVHGPRRQSFLSQLSSVWALLFLLSLFLLSNLLLHTILWMHTDILQPIPIDGQPTLCWPWDYLKRQEWMNLQLHPFCHPFLDRSQAILPNPMNISSGIFTPWQVMFHFHFPHVLIHQYLADLFGAKAICKSLSWALWEDVKMNKPWFVPTGSLPGQPPFFIMVPRRFRKAR